MKASKLSRSASVLLASMAFLVIVSIAICVVLMKLNILSTPAFLENLLYERDPQNGILSSAGIPEIHSKEEELRELYYDLNPSELLDTITERSAYTRTIRVIHSYNGDHTFERYTIARDASCWRADSDNRQFIWNGRELYIREGEASFRFDNGEFNFFEEIGITPLNQIRQVAAEKGYQYRLSDDSKLLKITVQDDENEIRNEYEISVETGVVLSESSYFRGSAFRTVITDSVDLFGADTLPEGYFDIP